MSSTDIIINDGAVQSINSYPRPFVPIVAFDLTDKYAVSSVHQIRIIAPDIDQFLIQFTDGFHGAAMPTIKDFSEQTINDSEIEIKIDAPEMYPSINPINVYIPSMGDTTSSEEESEEETHEITGNITKDSKIIVLDNVTSELIKTKNVSAGAYSVSLPNRVVDVLSKANEDGEPRAHSSVAPVEKP